MRYLVTRVARGVLKDYAPVVSKNYTEAAALMLHYLNQDLYHLDRLACVSRRRRGYRIFNGTDYAKVKLTPIK